MSWIATAVAVLLGIALVAYLALGTVTNKARVTGIVMPESGAVVVSVPDAGLVTEIHAKEGELVRKGAPLFTISTKRDGLKGEFATLNEQQIEARRNALLAEQHARTQQQTTRRRELTEQCEQLRFEITQVEEEITAGRKRLGLLESSLQRVRALESQGYVAGAQIESKQIDVVDQQGRINTLLRTKSQSAASLRTAESEIHQLKDEVLAVKAQFERQYAQLNQEGLDNLSKRDLVLLAPVDGVVVTVATLVGQWATPSLGLATVIPVDQNGKKSELEVVLYAPSRVSGFVERGQQVFLRYQAFPYEKYGLKKGWVADVSSIPLSQNELPQHFLGSILSNAQNSAGDFRAGESLYRIRVKIDAQSILADGYDRQIRPGMTVDADIIQDERRIWEWIASPLYSLRQP